jgi:hypothetical protein
VNVLPILAALAEALRAVEGLRVYEDLGAAVDPPGAVLGPPTFAFDAYAPVATGATVPLSIAVAADEWALPRLVELLPAVVAAVDSVPDAVVRTATPGVLPAGNGELPAYLLEIEVPLS